MRSAHMFVVLKCCNTGYQARNQTGDGGFTVVDLSVAMVCKALPCSAAARGDVVVSCNTAR